jgi:hypothetical protein
MSGKFLARTAMPRADGGSRTGLRRGSCRTAVGRPVAGASDQACAGAARLRRHSPGMATKALCTPRSPTSPSSGHRSIGCARVCRDVPPPRTVLARGRAECPDMDCQRLDRYQAQVRAERRVGRAIIKSSSPRWLHNSPRLRPRTARQAVCLCTAALGVNVRF